MRLLLCLALLGCADEAEEATLRGSVSRVYDLDFTAVRARLDDTELAIQYVDDGLVPVQIVVRVTEAPLAGPATVDLTAYGAVVGARAGVRLPDFVRGTLTLSEYAPEDGAPVVGEFDAVLTTGEQSLTVLGRFDTVLTDIR